jgi:two-component system, sporulation sensor kinase E
MLPVIDDHLLKETILSDTIINSLPGIFYLYNDALEFLLWNKNFETVLGYNADELKKLHVLEVIAEEDRAAIMQAINQVFTEGESMIEACAITRDHQKIPFFFTGKRLIYQGQTCLLGTGIDISSRLKVEDELRASEQKYKLLFDSNPAPMWMIARDDLSIIAANEAAARLYGYTHNELVKLNATALRPVEDLPLQLERYKHDIPTTEPTAVRHLKKDGTMMLVNIYSFDCIFEGRPARLSITHDITEKLKAEQLLQRSEANLQTILNTTDTAYALFDLDLNILAFNHKAAEFVAVRYNHTLEKGDYLLNYFPADKFPTLIDHLGLVLKGTHLRFERLLPYPDGSEHWFYIRLSPIINDDGKVIGVMITLHDITEQKNAGQNLKTAYIRIQNHIDSIKNMAWKQSHLMRSPLANLKGLTALLKENPPDRSVIIEHMETELNRMDDIIIEMAKEASKHDGGLSGDNLKAE